MKWINEKYHKPRMSELGKELLEAVENDDWKVSEHTITHKKSNIRLWTSNGFSHFRLHDVPFEEYRSVPEQFLEHALNYHDRRVLWDASKELREDFKNLPANITLNTLRLARQTESINQ
jgi:hypothetical protein